jgi:hypothetical protein
LDFEAYVETVEKANNAFFSDGLAKSQSMASLFKKIQSESKAREFSELPNPRGSSRNPLDHPLSKKMRD